jgi:hypothetical protein
MGQRQLLAILQRVDFLHRRAVLDSHTHVCASIRSDICYDSAGCGHHDFLVCRLHCRRRADLLPIRVYTL